MGEVLVYDAADQYVVLFGGRLSWQGVYPGDASDFSNQTWTFANNTWNQIHPVSAPCGRSESAAAYDAADGYVVLFSGMGTANCEVPRDTWSFVHGQWHQLAPKISPPRRYMASMAYDPASRSTILFGGEEGWLGQPPPHQNDTWSFVHGNWSRLNLTVAPESRIRAGLDYFAPDRALVLFGGYVSSSVTNDTWSFMGGRWVRDWPSTSPPGRAAAGMVYDPLEGKLILFGGYGSLGYLNDTWVYGGGSWTEVCSPCRPYSSWEPGLAFDGLDGYAILFGGNGCPKEVAQMCHSTWRSNSLIPTLRISQFIATPSRLDLGASLRFSVQSVGGNLPLVYNYSGLPPGCSSQNQVSLVCAPQANGTFNVSVTITDSQGIGSSARVLVAVFGDLSTSPLSIIPPTVDLGQSIVISTVLTGGAQGYRYAFSGLPSGCPLPRADLGTFSCMPAQVGSFVLSVRATDGTGATRNSTAVLTVLSAPILRVSTFAKPSIDLGQTMQLVLNASGGLSPFVIPAGGLPPDCQGAFPLLSCSPGRSGTVVIPVAVEDQLHSVASTSITVMVALPPTILAFNASPSVTDVGLPIHLTVATSGGTGILRFDYSNLPNGCPPVNSADLSCTPGASGEDTVVVAVRDEAGESALGFLHLQINAPPTLYAVGGPTINASLGNLVTIALVRSGGTPPFSYDYVGLPAACPRANNSTVSCVPALTGTFGLNVTVRDAAGLSSFLRLSLVVRDQANQVAAQDTLPLWVAIIGLSAATLGLGVIVIRSQARRRR